MKNLCFLLFGLMFMACHMSPEAKSNNREVTMVGNWEAAPATYLEMEDEIDIIPTRNGEQISPLIATEINVRTPAMPREVIKKADYKLQVEDLDKSTSEIHKLAEQHDAFVSGMNLNSSANMVNNVMTIRVPNLHFEPLLEAISAQAIFTNHKKIYSEDVTEQYVDIQSRLKVKKEIKEKYEKMLREDAKSLAQIFNAEEKIRVLQEEIEAKEGKLRYLADKVDLSEIKLEIYQQVEYQDKLFVQNKSFFQKSKDGFLNGWGHVQVVLLTMLNVWPMVFLFGMVWFKRERFYDLINKEKGGKRREDDFEQ